MENNFSLMKKDSLISVVIPIYNPCEYFDATLLSIGNQSYSNFEVIISDDSNTDRAYLEYIVSLKDNRFKYLKNHDSKGIFPNLNNAINHCSGKYIQIFCQDDVMKENFLQKQVALLEKYTSAGMVFSNYEILNSKGEITKLSSEYDYRKNWEELIEKRTFKGLLWLYNSVPSNISPVMIRKKCLDRIGNFDEVGDYANDLEYWYLVATKFDIAYNIEPLLYLRNHIQQASRTLGVMKMIEESSKIHQRFFGDLVNDGYSKITLIKYLNYNRGVFFLKVYLRNYFFDNPRSIIRFLRCLHRHPFSLNKILFYTIVTFFGKLNTIPSLSYKNMNVAKLEKEQ